MSDNSNPFVAAFLASRERNDVKKFRQQQLQMQQQANFAEQNARQQQLDMQQNSEWANQKRARDLFELQQQEFVQKQKSLADADKMKVMAGLTSGVFQPGQMNVQVPGVVPTNPMTVAHPDAHDVGGVQVAPSTPEQAAKAAGRFHGAETAGKLQAEQEWRTAVANKLPLNEQQKQLYIALGDKFMEPKNAEQAEVQALMTTPGMTHEALLHGLTKMADRHARNQRSAGQEALAAAQTDLLKKRADKEDNNDVGSALANAVSAIVATDPSMKNAKPNDIRQKEQALLGQLAANPNADPALLQQLGVKKLNAAHIGSAANHLNSRKLNTNNPDFLQMMLAMGQGQNKQQ